MSEAGELVAGRYRLLAVLGAGGMGRVWRARDTALAVDVAVKEVQFERGLSAEERAQLLARAQREARNAAQLRDHPNVVAVYDVLVEDERPWIVMRLIHGTALVDLLARHGPLSADMALRVAQALLDALTAAHKAGIVHRDVKPANVMLAEDGRVLLMDFGIAKQSGETSMTGTGMFIGSLEYIAPERMRGGEDEPASDLFSLGATLYHLVTGHSPFRRANPAASLSAVLSEMPSAPLPPGPLSTLIMALLAKDPAHRPSAAQASAMLAAPRAAVVHEPPPLPQTPPPSRPQPRPGQPPQPAQLPQPAQPPQPRAPHPPAPAVFAAPTVTAPAAPGVPTRLVRTIKGYKGIAGALAFAPDARTVAAAGSDGVVRLWNTVAGVATAALSRHKGQVRCVAYRPDGAQLATGGADGAVAFWGIPEGAPPIAKPVVLFGHLAAVTALAFSPDGTLLVSGGADGVVCLWNALTGTLIRELGDEFESVEAVSFAPGGTSVAAAGAGTGVVTWDVYTGKRLQRMRLDGADVSVFTHGQNGELIVAREHEGREYVTAVQPGRPPVVLTGMIADLCCARLSPDRRILITGSTRGSVHLWNVADQSLLASLGEHRDPKRQIPVLDATLSAGNRFLAVTGGPALWIYARADAVR